MRAGLGSIIPLQLLTMLSPLEMELRTCGLPYINLEFLKVSGPSERFLSQLTCLRAPALSHHPEGKAVLATMPPHLSLTCSCPCQLGHLGPVTLRLVGTVTGPAQRGQWYHSQSPCCRAWCPHTDQRCNGPVSCSHHFPAAPCPGIGPTWGGTG